MISISGSRPRANADVIERQTDGKMRVTSGSWDREKVILRDQVLEVHNVEGGCTSRESLCTTDKGKPAD
jgi:hypothetical protein